MSFGLTNHPADLARGMSIYIDEMMVSQQLLGLDI